MLHYERIGSGKTCLVLLHGYCENNTCFNEQVLFFKDLCTTLTIDLPGFGKSQHYEAASIEDMADQVKAIIEKENLVQVIMLGHSMGGYVCLAFANKYKEYLEGFGIIASTANADSDERKDKRIQVINFIKQQGKEAYIKNFIPGLFKPGFDTNIIKERIQEANKGSEKGMTEAAIAMMNRPDSNFVFKESNLPVFFAIGKLDELIPAQHLFEQAALCKIAQVVLLEDSAHMPMFETPTQLNIAIESFIQLVRTNS